MVIHRGREFTCAAGLACVLLKLDEPFFSADGINGSSTNGHLPMPTESHGPASTI